MMVSQMTFLDWNSSIIHDDTQFFLLAGGVTSPQERARFLPVSILPIIKKPPSRWFLKAKIPVASERVLPRAYWQDRQRLA